MVNAKCVTFRRVKLHLPCGGLVAHECTVSISLQGSAVTLVLTNGDF